MENALELLKKILRKNGVFVTSARKTVFVALWDKKPQTMREIEDSIGSGINRVSIYRVVNLFIDLGIVQKVQIGWKYKIELSDIFVKHHHHISCTKCGQIIAIHEHRDIERLIDRIVETYRFTDASHQLEIQGVCERCRHG